MNFLDAAKIEKLDERLSAIVKEDYADCGGTIFAEVSKVEITYDYDDPLVDITIHFGRYGTLNKEHDFDHTVEIVYKSDNFEFIAGQFAQKIIDENL